MDNVIEGLVLTFTDITQRVMAEAALLEARAREFAENIVNTVREPLIVLDGDLKVVSASRSFYEHFRVSPEETVGRPIYDLGNRQWDIPALRKLLEDILPHDQKFEGYVVEHDFPAVGRRKMVLNARRVVGETGNKQLILLAMQQVP
jgi:two-component system CheB/CheR fusion protein